MKFLLISCVLSLFALLGTLALVLVLAVPFQWLWNGALSAHFGVAPISYAEAVGLLALVSLVKTVSRGVTVKAKLGFDGL